MSYTEPLNDEELLNIVFGLNRLTANELRRILAETKRYIGFEGTIASLGIIKETLRGQPLAEFLAEKPYIIQTLDPVMASYFFRNHPALPQPVLVLEIPYGQVGETGRGSPIIGKNFACLGLKDVEIIDANPATVFAPGCIVLPPWVEHPLAHWSK